MIHKLIPALIATVLLLLVGCGHRNAPAAAQYIDGAEIQAETDTQRANIEQAFSDMLSLTPDQLKNTRYGPDRKTLPALLRGHVVPNGPVAVEDEDFYTQAAHPQVRAAVEKLRDKMKKESP